MLLNTLLQILSYPGVVELTTQLLLIKNILWLPLCRINKFGLNALPSKTVAIPYTCGLSRQISGAYLLFRCYCYNHYKTQKYYFCYRYHYYHITLLLNTLLQILSYPGVVELTTQLLLIKNILWLPLCRINKFGLNALPSKTVAIPYTCGLSRQISGAVAGEHISIL